MRVLVADIEAVGIYPYSCTKGIDPARFKLIPIEDGVQPVHAGIAYLRTTENPLILDYVRLCQEAFEQATR